MMLKVQRKYFILFKHLLFNIHEKILKYEVVCVTCHFVLLKQQDELQKKYLSIQKHLVILYY